MRRPAATWSSLAALAVLLLPQAAAAYAPVPPTTSFASPHEAAYAALLRVQTSAGRVPSDPGGSTYFTHEQMMAVLVHLHRAELFPQRAATERANALRTWDQAEVAYHPQEQYYDSTLTARAVCVPLEDNAWALLAATRLANATGRADLAQRAREVGDTVAAALVSETIRGVPRCPLSGTPPPSQWPLPIWAVLLHVDAGLGGPGARSSALQRLDQEITARWDAGAFRDATGLFLATPNSQYLLALQAADRASPGRYAATRDELAQSLTNRFAIADGAFLQVHSLQRVGDQYQPTGTSLEGQVWAALALHNQRNHNLDTDVPERLLATLFTRAWSTDEGGFATPGSALAVKTNLLAALFTSGPAFTDVTSEGARITLVVPARSRFDYPRPGQPDADRYLVDNEWVFRFGLTPVGPPLQPVVLPLSRLGPIQHTFAAGPYAGAPELQRGGAAVPAQAEGGPFPLLKFAATLQPATSYRYTDYAPVLPLSSQLRREIRLFLGTDAAQPVSLSLLRLEVAAAGVRVESVRFNDVLLPASGYDVSDVEPTESLPQPHLRVDLRNVMVRPDVPNEVLIVYTDPLPPVLGSPVLSEDAFGEVPVRVQAGRHVVTTGGDVHVRVMARDNAAIRAVLMRLALGTNVTEVAMAPTGEADVWAARLPPLPARQVLQLSLVAVDEHGLLSNVEEVSLIAQPPFLQEGNLVLLVFSATLLASAIVIYFKMGRRRKA